MYYLKRISSVSQLSEMLQIICMLHLPHLIHPLSPSYYLNGGVTPYSESKYSLESISGKYLENGWSDQHGNFSIDFVNCCITPSHLTYQQIK